MKEIVTENNNKYYFTCYSKHKNMINRWLTSMEYTSEIKALKDFCLNIESGDFVWGQFICHHYADQCQKEIEEVILTLEDGD